MVGHGKGRAAPASGGRLRRCVALSSTLLWVVAGVVGVAVPEGPSAGSSVGGDRSTMGRLAQRIAADGAHIQQLVIRYDRAQAEAHVAGVRLAATRAALAADEGAQARATVTLRKVAVEAYVTAGGVSAPSLLSGSAVTAGMASVYVTVAGRRLQGAVFAFQRDEARTRVTAAVLGEEEARAEATIRELRPAERAAQAAVAGQETLLGKVRGNLQVLLAAAAARRARAEQAQERRIAAAEAAAAARAAPAPAPVPQLAADPPPGSTAGGPSGTASPAGSAPAPPAPPGGGYADPLRAVGGLSPERIDQGVDYQGYGPIYAIGDGVVLSTYNAGWPGGTFIAYRLTDGPAAGLTAYAAEDINPAVQVGEAVTPATEIGVVYAGPDGIETGWAAPGGVGDTMALVEGQFSGANSTAFGANFSQLLTSLGAPGGIVQNAPTGTLPSGWPSW